MAQMIAYFGSDVRRINHALKVHAFAAMLGTQEGLSADEQQTLELSALLHDIGIPEAERIYHSTAGKYQELLGPPAARKILDLCAVPEPTQTRILYLIGNHHSYNKIDGTDFQLLVEADLLVNIFEDAVESLGAASVINQYFKTESGKKLGALLYPYVED